MTALGDKSVAFAFQVEPWILVMGGVFTIVMGLVGGLLPALSAMRIEALESMR